MIDRDHELSIARQAKALKMSRGAVYYKPRPVSDADLQIMRRVDQLHLDHPFMGARMLRDMLNREGVETGRRHVATLMRRMGIEAIYRRPNTSKATPDHKIYPYLPRKVKIEKPNHVWAMDITYIPMARGFVYLAAVVDWAPAGSLASRVDHDGDGFLRRGVGGGAGQARQAGNLQHGSRQPVYQRGLHGRDGRAD
jgi:putative transposase